MKFVIVSFLVAVLLGLFSRGEALDTLVCRSTDQFASNTCSALCNIAGQGAGYCNEAKQCICLLNN
uniref:Invertebrate defensins family profile domain-containing protein n=1 Tax=Anopheles atroparvus TaxID=41427 RepID=A0A2C9GSM8_ANOAO